MSRNLCIWLVSLLVLLCFQTGQANANAPINNATQLVADLAQLPQCAIECASLLSSSTCSASSITEDVNCLCTTGNPTNATSAAQQCVMLKCSTKDILEVQRVIQNICGVPVRNVGGTIVAVTVAFAAVAYVTFAIRMGVRARSWGLLGVDDIFIFTATIISIILLVSMVMLVKAGLGKDLWGVQYNDIYQIFFWFYIAEILYIVCVFLTKLSVLCFYLRVFTEPSFFWKTYILIGLTSAGLVAMFFATLFQCSPISFTWQSWDKLHQGKCLSIHGLLYANAIVNISLDGLIILLPIPTLMALTLPWIRKLGLILVFSLGALTTIVSALRFEALIHITFNALDFSYDLKTAAYWSVVEIYVGIICVCLPAIRPFLRAVRIAIFGDPRKNQIYEFADDGKERLRRDGSSGGSGKSKSGNTTLRSESTEELFELGKT